MCSPVALHRRDISVQNFGYVRYNFRCDRVCFSFLAFLFWFGCQNLGHGASVGLRAVVGFVSVVLVYLAQFVCPAARAGAAA